MADSGGNDRRHIPTSSGNPTTCETFRDEVWVWRLGENLIVNYSLGARMVAGLSGPARTLCMRMAATDMHPAALDHDGSGTGGEPYVQALESIRRPG